MLTDRRCSRHQPATQRMEGARKVRDNLIGQTLLLVRALTFHYPSHLQPAYRGYVDAWNWFVCVHLPAGPITFRVAPHEELLFEHLKREQQHSFDRATQQDKVDRLAALGGSK